MSNYKTFSATYSDVIETLAMDMDMSDIAMTLNEIKKIIQEQIVYLTEEGTEADKKTADDYESVKKLLEVSYEILMATEK